MHQLELTVDAQAADPGIVRADAPLREFVSSAENRRGDYAALGVQSYIEELQSFHLSS